MFSLFLQKRTATHAATLNRIFRDRLARLKPRLCHLLNQSQIWQNGFLIASALAAAVLADQWSANRALLAWDNTHFASAPTVGRVLSSFGFSPCADAKLGHTLLKLYLRENPFPITPTIALAHASAGVAATHLFWFRSDLNSPVLYSKNCHTPNPKRGEHKPIPAKFENFSQIRPPATPSAMAWTPVEDLIAALEKESKLVAPRTQPVKPRRSSFEIAY